MSFPEFGEIVEKSNSASFPEFGEIISDRKPSQLKEIPTQAAVGAAEGALGGPGTLGETIQKLVDMLPGAQQSANLRRNIARFLFPGLSGLNIEDIQRIEKGLAGEKLQPKTPGGAISRKAGEFTGSALTTGEVSPAILAVSGLAGGAGQLARESGLPEEIATGAELLSPLAARGAIKAIAPSKSGALRSALNKKQQLFYDQAKKLGLSDEEITPLIQSEKRAKILGPLAKKTKSAGKALMESKTGVGELYQPLKQRAESLGSYSAAQANELTEDLSKISAKLKKTPSPSSEKKKAIDFLDDAIRNIDEKGTSPDQIINFFQDINEQRLYEHLAPAKEALKKSLKGVDPDLSKDLDFLNSAYSKAIKMRKQMGVGDLEKLISFGERAAVLAGLAKGALYGGGFGLAGTVVGERLARQIATKLLTDPRWQGINRNLVKAASKHSSSAASATFNQLKEKIKEDFPEEYGEIVWPID